MKAWSLCLTGGVQVNKAKDYLWRSNARNNRSLNLSEDIYFNTFRRTVIQVNLLMHTRVYFKSRGLVPRGEVALITM